MSTAVFRGLAESFLERETPPLPRSVRLRIYVIASALFVNGLVSIESMFVDPRLIDVVGIFEVLAAVGLLLRNQTGLRLAVLLTILAGIGSSAALTGLPNALLLSWAGSALPDNALVSAIAVMEIVIFALAVGCALGSWWKWEADMRAFGRRFAVPLRIFAMIGAFESVAGNALRIVGVQVFSFPSLDIAHLTELPFVVVLAAVATLPEFVFIFWSYGVLRSEATRMYFRVQPFGVVEQGRGGRP